MFITCIFIETYFAHIIYSIAITSNRTGVMTAGVLRARHPRVNPGSLVVDLARARVESQVVDLAVLLVIGATSGVSLALYLFFLTLHLFPFAHNI